MVEMVRCGGGKREITQGHHNEVLGPCRNKNKGHMRLHSPPMAKNRAALGTPSILIQHY